MEVGDLLAVGTACRQRRSQRVARASAEATRYCADLVGRDLADGRDAGGGLGDQDADPGELERAEAAGVEGVGQQGRVLDLEVAGVDAGLERATEDGAGSAEIAAAQPEQRALGDLVEQLGAAAPHQRLRAVDERRVGQAVVDERARPVPRAARGASRAGVVGRLEGLVELVEIARPG